jgi:hypothetical protein
VIAALSAVGRAVRSLSGINFPSEAGPNAAALGHEGAEAQACAAARPGADIGTSSETEGEEK